MGSFTMGAQVYKNDHNIFLVIKIEAFTKYNMKSVAIVLDVLKKSPKLSQLFF